MKRVFLPLFFILATGSAYAAISNIAWWTRPSICRPSTVQCYPGIELAGNQRFTNDWDNVRGCWGKKIICPNASGRSWPEPLSITEIDDRRLAAADFDFDGMGEDSGRPCFGVRRTRASGREAMVGDRWVNVFCPGILESSDETLSTGEIRLAADDQPTCTELAMDGNIGVQNNQCFGRPVAANRNASDFTIFCEAGRLSPSLIVDRSGAQTAEEVDVSGLTGPALSNFLAGFAYPLTESEANRRFDMMVNTAMQQQLKFSAGN